MQIKYPIIPEIHKKSPILSVDAALRILTARGAEAVTKTLRAAGDASER